jgi:hypothetical protein
MSVGSKRKASARRGLLAGLALASTVLGGCSFALVDRAPPRNNWWSDYKWGIDLNHCTASPAAPIADGAFGLGLLWSALHYASDGGDAGPTVGLLIMIPAVVYLASSVYGFDATSECRTYRAGPP